MASANALVSMESMDVQDGYNDEYDSSKHRKLNSKAWDDMERIIENNEVKAKCKYCKKLLGASSNKGTSHLLHHIKRCPKKRNKNIRQHMLKAHTSADGSILVKVHKFDDEESRKSLITFLVAGKHLFTIVEEPAFRYFMSVNCPEFKNISRHTTRRELFSYYVKERELV